ncbi:hypothetical protein BGZ93_007687 [Podila epicladia]|nr:hypothetical protein BGZ93_007687 [Podila epicladia]
MEPVINRVPSMYIRARQREFIDDGPPSERTKHTLEHTTTDHETLGILRPLPCEIINGICNYLFPSQLSRMSRVNQTLHAIVSGHPKWKLIFNIAHMFQRLERRSDLNPTGDALPNNIYMQYVCAESALICEQCFVRCCANRNVYDRPVPTLEIPKVPPDAHDSPARAWHVRRCPSCRLEHYRAIRSHILIPPRIENGYKYKEDLRRLYRLTNKSIKRITDRVRDRPTGALRYREQDALIEFRILYGEGPYHGTIQKEDPILVRRDEWRMDRVQCSFKLVPLTLDAEWKEKWRINVLRLMRFV